ncbi:MAG: helix-turn-helix transcriptional regulator [Acidobacteriota bacterium]
MAATNVSTEDAIAVRSLALRFPKDHVIEPHQHPWGQVVYATEGVLTVDTEEGAWVIPSHRAAWVPASTLHRVATTGRVRLRTLYLRPDICRALPESCCVLSVSALLRELVLETIRLGMLRQDVPEQWRLAQVLIDQVGVTAEIPLDLRWPLDARARRVADAVQSDLSSTATLRDLAVDSGASVRTLERLFTRDTGMTFSRWRQQARLLAALRYLAAGESVTSTALAVGFNGTSAFIAMFRRALGRTPGSYFRAKGEPMG